MRRARGDLSVMPKPVRTTISLLASTPVPAVAQRTLEERLLELRHAWRRVAHAGKHRPAAEDVHQLRIQMRRTEAALQLFAPVLWAEAAEPLARIVRKARRRAGEARDCDLLLALRERSGSPISGEIATLLQDRRRKVIAKLVKGYRQHIRSGALEVGLKRCLTLPPASIDADPAPPEAFGAWFLPHLSRSSREFLALAAPPVRSRAAVHPLRMAGKRVRYALELGLPVTPRPVARGLHALLVQLQRRTGKVCDGLAMARQYRELAALASPGETRRYRAAIRASEARASRAYANFRAWWTAPRRRALREWLGPGNVSRHVRADGPRS